MRAKVTAERGHGNVFVIGVLVGAAIGATVGLMLAPKAGRELRDDLANSTERLRRRTAETFDEAVEKMSGLVSQGRKVFQNGEAAASEMASAAANSVKSQAQALGV